MRDNEVYFAQLEADDPQYLEELLDKVDKFRNFCADRGKFTKWQRSMNNYYGVSSDGLKSSNTITRGGDSGELSMIKINDYRNLVQHQLILITGNRPAGQAKAINSDPKSLHQARIGSLLTEYYLSQVGWEELFYKGAEASQTVDEAFFVLDWDANTGEPVTADQETGQMIKEGDATLRVIMPWNMARDPYVQDPSDLKWGIYTYRINKWDLAARFPQYRDIIIENKRDQSKPFPFTSIDTDDTDQIEVNVLSHNKSDACPQGRVTQFINDQILLDVPALPFSEWNVYRIASNDILDTAFGYTNNNDLLAPEMVTDSLHSIITTNQINFGAQCIKAAKGAGIDFTHLSNGSTFIELEPAFFDKLEAIQMTTTAPEIFAYAETLSRKKETIAGINSVVRGDPEGALRSNSGSALALVQAQSLQFQSGAQRSYYHALSKVNTGLIKLLQRYAATERIIRITGKVQGQYLEEFKYTGDELKNVSCVTFEMVDPVFQSIGGKVAIADNLLAKNMIKNARQYLTVVRTGSLDAFTEDDEADEIGIKSENELLREGQPVMAIMVENHEEHIEGHMSVIASPNSKKNKALVDATLAHILEHASMWQQLSMTNPALLIATKQKVLPPPPQLGMQVGPTGQNVPIAPSGGDTGQSEGGKLQTPQILDSVPPLEQKAAEVQQPRMPINKATGQRAVVPGAN